MNNKNSGVLIAAGAVFLAVVLTVTTVATASRNSSGTMSAANGPYISGTSVSSVAINARFSDIENEITDSLSRSAKGGMTAPLKGTDGTVAAPAYSFTNEPGSGWYRIGASDLGLAILGAKVFEVTGSALKPQFTIETIDGSVGTPAYSFVNDVQTGLYRIGAGDLGWAIVGVKKLELTGSHFTVTPSMTVSGTLGAAGGLSIGASGTSISGSFEGSASITPANINAQQCANLTSITVTGAATGSVCVVGSPVAGVNATSVSCAITSANTCTIQLCNGTAGVLTPTAGTYRCRVFNP